MLNFDKPRKCLEGELSLTLRLGTCITLTLLVSVFLGLWLCLHVKHWTYRTVLGQTHFIVLSIYDTSNCKLNLETILNIRNILIKFVYKFDLK